MNIFEKTNRYFTFSGSINKNKEFFSSSYITKFNKQKFIPKEATIDNEVGLRKPQVGALYAIQAHWTLSTDDATIVLPTGTGKSETMFATIISKNINRTLIVVPSKLLRNQTYDRAKKWGILGDIGCLDEDTICPNTLMLKSNTKDFESFKKVVSNSNIIISTIALLDRMDKTYKKYLSDSCDLLIVDEAHHVSSKTWSNLKMYFNKKKVLQFTATPFREDKKLVDGKIIYNFPMHMAIEQNYFQPINFISIEEYDDNKVDIEIAKKAVSILENDLKSNFKHVLLVRANNIERAKQLYENVYSRYKKYNPVLITSKTTKINREKLMESIKNGDSKIVICVDMFGEGIDIPNLKIAALHDKFKSLPITLQFIGRFARSKKNLGNAKIVANIADVNFMNSLKDLYESDSDWNLLLPIKSEQNIQDKIELQELISGFKVNNTEIDLRQLRPKVSMRVFKYNDTGKWNPNAWVDCFDSFKCQGFINEEEKMLIVIEPYKSCQGWTTQRNIESLNWNFYVVYWNVEKGYVCINDTNHQLGSNLLKNIFDEEHLNQIKSEPIFRCLANINRLSLGTIGLNSAINGPIRYKMFAGIDVSQGIAESQKLNSYKSNLFGVGYDGNGKISIGCSYKGKIWSRWVESISFWKNWCDNIMTKILDEKNDSRILDNLLIPTITDSLPESVAYRIDFDDSIVFSELKITIQTLTEIVNIDDCELNIDIKHNNEQNFKLLCGYEVYNYCLKIEDNNFKFKFLNSDKQEPQILKSNKNPIPLSRYFDNNPPKIYYTDSSFLEGNILTIANENKVTLFNSNNIIPWNWSNMGVNIRTESQISKSGEIIKNSIQYNTISKLKSSNYDVIFDDDDSGEVADIVTFKDSGESILIEFYHCKYSPADKPGARISDLYEVCGQAEKSVHWKLKAIEMIDRLKSRDAKRISRNGVSRIIEGNIDDLNIIQKKLLFKKADLKIFIVQPGVDSSKITKEMLTVLGSTSDYCLETYSVPVKIICS